MCVHHGRLSRRRAARGVPDVIRIGGEHAWERLPVPGVIGVDAPVGSHQLHTVAAADIGREPGQVLVVSPHTHVVRRGRGLRGEAVVVVDDLAGLRVHPGEPAAVGGPDLDAIEVAAGVGVNHQVGLPLAGEGGPPRGGNGLRLRGAEADGTRRSDFRVVGTDHRRAHAGIVRVDRDLAAQHLRATHDLPVPLGGYPCRAARLAGHQPHVGRNGERRCNRSRECAETGTRPGRLGLE